MNRTARRVLTIAAVAGALLVAPAAAAQAAPAHHWCGGSISQVNGDNVGLLNGTQVAVPVDLDLNVTHNALGLLGSANASGDDVTSCSDGGAGVYPSGIHHPRPHHRHHRHHPRFFHWYRGFRY